MTVLIVLTTAGASTGPFNLYSDVDGYTTAFEVGVVKSALVAGYTSSLVPNGTTIVRVTSVGSCTNYIDLTLTEPTTTTTTSTTSTTTTTTTLIPPGQFQVQVDMTNPDGVINSITGTDLPAGLDTVNQTAGPITAFFFTGTVVSQTLVINVTNGLTDPVNLSVYYSADGTTEYTPISAGVSTDNYNVPLTQDVVAPDYVLVQLGGATG